jgi:hypothetical protein
MKSLKKYFLVVFITVLFLAVTIFNLPERILSGIGDFLTVQDALHRADVIHVIAGPDHRTDYAIHLYKLGYGKGIFFSGGWCRDQHYYHGEHSRKRALEQGIPLEKSVTDASQVTGSYSKIVRLKELMGNSPYPINPIPASQLMSLWNGKLLLGNRMNHSGRVSKISLYDLL